ncbi:MAG: GumC family protein [Fimbriimonadaceae bacterium]
MDSKPVDLSVYLNHVWRDKFKVAMVGVVFAVIALLYTFFIPAEYRSVSVLLLPPSQGGSAGSLLSMFTGSAGTANPVVTLQGVAMSRTTLEAVSKKEGIPLAKVRDMVSVVPSIDSNQLGLTVVSQNRDQALRVCEALLASLTRINQDTNVSINQLKAKALQDAVNAKQRELEAAQDRLVDFQRTTLTAPSPIGDTTGATMLARLRDVELELGKVQEQIRVARDTAQGQSQVAVSLPTGIAESEKWRNKLVELEASKRLLLQSKGPADPAVVKLEREIEETRVIAAEQIAKYVRSVNENVEGSLAGLVGQEQVLIWQRDYLRNLANLAPQEAAELQRLVAEVITQQEILRGIRVNYEQARVDAEVEPVNWTVLVPPYADPVPTNKNYRLNAIFGFVLGVLVGACWSLYRNRNYTFTPESAV